MSSSNENFVHETAIVDKGARIGKGTRVWHWVHICGGAVIGDECSLGQNVFIANRAVIGNKVKIQNNVSVYDDVTLEDGVFCGPSCVFTNVNNPRAEIDRKSEYRPTTVGRGASIGANATIVCGNKLGQYCFIAAGAVVVTNVPDFALMVGVPARQDGWMSKSGARLSDDLICPISGVQYAIGGNGQLSEISEG